MLLGNSHEQWDLFQFPELVTRLAEAKLSFVCSATLVENVDTLRRSARVGGAGGGDRRSDHAGNVARDSVPVWRRLGVL